MQYFHSKSALVLLTSTLFLAACSDNDEAEIIEPDPAPGYISEFKAKFSDASDEWQSGFADYPVGGETEWELTATPNQTFSLASGETASGYYLHSHNRSDDTQMYLTRQITDLKPGTHYEVALNVEMATNVNSQCVGIGGAPHAVTVKAGLSQQQPEASLDNLDHYRLNVDFGSQTNSGLDGLALGHIGEDSLTDCDPSGEMYALKQFNNQDVVFEVTSDDEGKLWVTIMTDSGFEGPTSIYFTEVSLEFTESEKTVEGFSEKLDFSQPQPMVTSTFFDYPVGREFEWEHTSEPQATVVDADGNEITGHLLHSYNRSDDTGMLLFSPVKGLAPDTQYEATFNVTIATNVNDQCFGIGGAPHSVAVKAGISSEQPQPYLPVDDDHYRLNVDFGNNMQGSDNALALGDIGAEDLTDCDPGSQVYTLKSFDSAESQSSITFTTDETGIVYFSVLTDSGFEGPTTMLFTEASVTFTRL